MWHPFRVSSALRGNRSVDVKWVRRLQHRMDHHQTLM